jgi:pimeloyl-ACP methyl ester carboxylesterase
VCAVTNKAEQSARDEIVVLVHGLWMRGPALLPLGWKLQTRGFSTRTFSYPSMARDLRENAKRLADFVASQDASTVHLVGHSLGGLLVLAMLASASDARISRVVLLGSPVRDCHCARYLARVPALSSVIGRSLPQWQHASADCLARLPSHIEIGVLAGTAGIGLGRVIPGLSRPNDGVVAVHETRLDQATDTIALPLSHSAMLLSGRCADQVAAFLRNGHFYHR